MARSLIALGSNWGDRRRTLDGAVESLAAQAGVCAVRRSPWRETAPVGGPLGQGAFLNGAAVLETALPPERLLDVLRAVERQFGRVRQQRWGPRSLDLDLLLYDQWVLESPDLVIPHPRMAWRRFVLESAAEVAGEMVHPGFGRSVAELLNHLNDAACYLAIGGPIGVGKTTFAREIGSRVAGQLVLDPCDDAQSERTLAQELDALERRRRRLAEAALPPPDGSHWLVSDFWLPQSLASAGVWLPAEQRVAYGRAWEEARRTVPAPKLTVLLDPPSAMTVGSGETIRRAILQQAAQTGQGPIYRLTASSTADRLAEVLAAIESMN